MPINYSKLAGDEEDCDSCEVLQQIQNSTPNFPKLSKPRQPTETPNQQTPQTVNTNQEEINNNDDKNIKEEENNRTEKINFKEGGPIGLEELGRSTWSLLHTIAAYYPNKPTEEKQQQTLNFFNSLSYVYPCRYCADDLKEELKESPPRVENQKELSLWLCGLHNKVNEKLGKPIFPCEFVDDRWKGKYSRH